MAIVSTRVDDEIKNEADEIAKQIGVPLSTAINIFIKKFISNSGFPFDVVASNKETNVPIVDKSLLDNILKEQFTDSNVNNLGLSKKFTYLDPITKRKVEVIRKE